MTVARLYSGNTELMIKRKYSIDEYTDSKYLKSQYVKTNYLFRQGRIILVLTVSKEETHIYVENSNEIEHMDSDTNRYPDFNTICS